MAAETPAQPAYIIEPFDPDHHDRSAFSCGVESIDNYLKLTARKQQGGDFSRIHVAVHPGEAAIVGFFALNAHSAESADLPDKLTRHAPRHGGVPVAYLSMLAVDRSAQGKGLGELLMLEVFEAVARASELMGVKCLILDVLDDGDADAMKRRAALYRRLGFASLPSRPLRMFIALTTIRQALAQ